MKQENAHLVFDGAEGITENGPPLLERVLGLIAYSRDRVEKKRPNIRGGDPRYLRYWGAQRVGYYRILEPAEKRKKEGCAGYRLRFELKELR